ncbi:MAG: hypothetical protein ACUVWX_12690, partial [Kiritimatiellia bacterium]
WLGAFLLIVATPVRLSSGEEFRPERLREEAELLARRAQELKAAGKTEEAERALRRAEELSLEIGRREKGAGTELPGEQRNLREGLMRELAELRARLKELDEVGRDKEAADLRYRIRKMEEQLGRLGVEGLAEEGRKWSGLMEAQDRPRPEMRIEPERRVELMRQAVECLRAAGMHEIADRVMGEIGRAEAQLRQRVEMRGEQPLPPVGEVERLKTEISELRRAMREMQERLERLAREQH